MSLGRCIADLTAKGELGRQEADHARAMFDAHLEDLRKSMGPAAAEAEATRLAIADLEGEQLERERRAGLQVKAQEFAGDWLTRGGENFGGGDRGGGGPGAPLPGEGEAGPVNPKAARTLLSLVEARRKAIEGEAFGHVSELLRRQRRTLRGHLRRPAEMDEIGRAAFGESEGVGLAARELAAAVGETQEWLRLRANAAGANIGKIEKRGFSTHHDSRAVAEAGFDSWWAAERPRWDLDQMIDEDTGQPFTQAKLNEVARGVFETIASDGASKREPGAAGRLSFANKLGQHRFIHYKSYGDWAASQAQFGRGTAFDALLGEVKGTSRAIAAMEILGPNPEATVRFVKDRVSGDPALFEPGQLRKRDKARAIGIHVDDMWNEYTGALRQPENRNLALAFSAYRAVTSAAKLGSSPLSAISDLGFGTATRKFNGLPAARIVGDYLKLLNPLDASDRKLAAQLSFIPEVWTSHVSGTHRFLAEELTGETAQRIADGVLRASGLMALTDAGRQAHGLATFVHFTNTRHQAFADLEPAWRAALQRYRIGETEWDQLRSAEVKAMGRGVELVTPATLPDGEAKNRFLEMAHTEQDFAVPVPDLETRTVLNKNVRKGTIAGEVLRSSPLMFKTFTVSTMLRHGGRLLDQSSAAGKMGYFVSVLIPVTIAGVFAQQLYEILAGRDPKPMDDPKLWGAGLVRGGGVGIVGDLAGATAQDPRMGLAEFAGGPLVSDVTGLAGPSLGLGRNAASDLGFNVKRDDRAPWKLARGVRNDVPGQNLWYFRLAIDRLLSDQIQQQIDPHYAQSWHRMQKRARDNGQDYWWAPGTPLPQRAPGVSNGGAGQ